MYSAVLLIHSWLRWIVLIAGIIAIARAFGARSRRRPWLPSDARAGMVFVSSLDLQMLLGLLLYFALSPFTREALTDFGAAMANPALRFWAVEHAFGMIVGVVLAHVGRARTKGARGDDRKHRAAMIFYTLALIAIVLSIPWPGMPNGRPMLRW